MKTISLFFIAVSLMGCATYQSKVSESRSLIEQGQYDLALEKLEKLANKKDGDQLVHLFDYGTALHIAGRYQDSNQVFSKAEKLADEVDYHSVSRVTGSFLFSEEVVQYKGDTFEKIFINAYMAMNYLQLGQLDDALVESRRINEKYLKYRADDKQAFDLNPFALYLAGLCWEADNKWDDAFLSYSDAAKLSAGYQEIEEDALRAAKMSRRLDEYKQRKEQYKNIVEKEDWYDKNLGEVIIIYQQGWGPRKDFDPFDSHFPILRGTHNFTTKARLYVDDVGSIDSSRVYDVESAAIQTLNDDRGLLVARRIGGIVAKEIVADQIRQKDRALGFIAWLTMHLSDRADLRQWSFLPKSIQVIRMRLKPGHYKIHISGLTEGGYETNEKMESRDLEIKARKKIFLNWRTFH